MRKQAGALLAAGLVAAGSVGAPRAEAATVSGTILVASQLNLTLTHSQSEGCKTTALQGFDGWLLDPGAATRISVVGKMAERLHDLNVFFIDRDCQAFKLVGSGGPDEMNVPIPAGTHRVFVQLLMGAAVPFEARLS